MIWGSVHVGGVDFIFGVCVGFIFGVVGFFGGVGGVGAGAGDGTMRNAIRKCGTGNILCVCLCFVVLLCLVRSLLLLIFILSISC